jgi:hypothetical protein
MMATKPKKMPPWMGKESKKEETMERKKAPGKAAYKKMEMMSEGEKYKKGGAVKRKGC